ncbi:MAG: hypothetical protein CVU73_06500 [Deltaproteobacteria bacterium HGW-Deltaproteobacteria-8]|nr:MAG: hypothetical protein CVU73_06500 [Deltaproteobacteria bacterium HGW-Deltaproteobacteria-8]
MTAPSAFGAAYQSIYNALCGSAPSPCPWHFQWLATCDLHRDLRGLLLNLGGDVLDLGCGAKPYQSWFSPSVCSYTGADVSGEGVDVLIEPDAPLPFADNSFDTLLCTQVLEHVRDLGLIVGEIARVLRPGGALVASAPFLYNLHGAPHDYRRFTEFGLRALFETDFDIVDLRRQGKVGSTGGQMLLNFVETSLNQRRATRLLKALLLPVWILFSTSVNLAARGVDLLDGTGHFSHNMLLVGRRK